MHCTTVVYTGLLEILLAAVSYYSIVWYYLEGAFRPAAEITVQKGLTKGLTWPRLDLHTAAEPNGRTP